MKPATCLIVVFIILVSCETKKSSLPITGTWQLLTGTLIESNDTIVTDYTTDKKFLKIINETHFSFTGHDTGKDSTTFFTAGSGSYSLKDSIYTEHLEFCSDRAWENHDFEFTLTISNDTLVQKGIEKIESSGINRLNIEKYVRVK